MNNWIYLAFSIIVITLISFMGCSSQSNDQAIINKLNVTNHVVRDLHSVNFHLTDENQTPINHALIIATDNSTINPLKGYTDENGNVTLVMRGSVQYNITASNLPDGQIVSTNLFPIDTEYNWSITPTPTPTPKPNPNAKFASDVQKLNDDTNTIVTGITNSVNFVLGFIQ